MEKSKFFNMKSKKNAGKKESIFDEPSAALTEVEIEQLLETVKEATDVIVESAKVEAIEVPILEAEPTTATQIVRKAYNIWQDPTSRMYMLDIITYSGEGDTLVMSFETKKLTLSQPMAMYEIKKIFTNKLILKRGEM